jgi:peptidoglycan/LPS O-acetylase OafA/YrhL
MATTIDPVESEPTVEPVETAKKSRIRHMPALDGMRGFFVIAGPLAYHFAPYWIPGGILGIDLFFVLSSFLIVTILLHEWDNHGKIDIGSYASRRVRRLFPALVLSFVVMSLITATVLDKAQIAKWTGGITAAMSYVANWREIFTGTSYFDASQYSNPQPFRHVWSFAIEEQFYLFAPFFLIFCLRWLSKKWIAILAILGAIASAIWMSMVFDPSNPQSLSRAYYGTDTRAFALLLGIAMAVVCHWWGQPRTSYGHWLTQFFGLISTIAFVILMFTTSEKTSWMFEYGGFFLVAVLSVFMTRAVSAENGWLHWFYNNKFLRWAGRLGFGLYLYHWFVYILVDSDKAADAPGLNNPRDLFLGFGLTFLIAWLSYKYVERPFTKGAWPGWKLAAGLGAGIILSLALLLYANTARRPAAVALADATGGQTTAVAMGTGAQCVAPPGSDPVKVLVVGDSVMVQLGQALRDWCAANPGQILVFSDAHLGCGTTRGGEKRYDQGPGSMGDVCATWADPVDPQVVADPEVVSWVTAVEAFQPDVVFTYASTWDAIDRKVPAVGINDWEKPGDPQYDAYLQSEYSEAIQTLTARGASLAWMISPYLNRDDPANAPDRTDRMNQITLPMVEALQRHALIDYPGYLGPVGGAQDRATRDDGTHVRADKLQEVADWLAPQIVAAGRSPGVPSDSAPPPSN